MTTTQQIIIVAMGVAATMLTRFIPFMVFRPGKPTPKYITYLGKVLPPSVFALLVIYCLRHLFLLQKSTADGWHFVLADDAAAQIIAVIFTVIIHLWRKNLMWSIAAGTICYMVLIR